MMFTLIFASLIQSSIASGPCGGAQVGFWTNPDASRGGTVATTAKVQAGAFIAPGAQVCESAQVKSGAKILGLAVVSGRAVINSGAEISGRAKVQGEAKVGGSNVATKIGGDVLVEGSAMVTGNSQVIARAKVRGGSKVHNAIICQASVIEGFDVIDSDYYCQTEDPEPQHPGELGMKTLLGVDSDRDGVRDDVEIWINDRFSNEPTKNKENKREFSKAMARLYGSLMKMGASPTLAQQIISHADCSEFVFSSAKESRRENSLLEGEFMDTEDRLMKFMGQQASLIKSADFSSKKNRSSCRKYVGENKK